MKHTWLSIAVIAAMATSCSSSKSDDVTPDTPKVPEWYLSEMVIRYEYKDNPLIKPGTIDSIIRTYNPDKTFNTMETFRGPRASLGPTYSLYKAFYNQQKVSKMTYQDSKTGTPEVINETRYVNNQLTRFFKPGLEATRYDSVVYENNKMVKVVHIDTIPSMSKIWEYTWENDNVVERKDYINVSNEGWKLIGIRKYDYTDFPNMSKSSASYFLLWGGAPDDAMFSTNAIRSISTYGTNGELFYKYTRSYSMNDNNLPATDTLWYTNAVAGTHQLYSVTRIKYIDLNK